jgi:hypothetical protein
MAGSKLATNAADDAAAAAADLAAGTAAAAGVLALVGVVCAPWCSLTALLAAV